MENVRAPRRSLTSSNPLDTDDRAIREALRLRLDNFHAGDPRLRIVEELGVEHGIARIDLAVINGFLHGYEIKSDRDTLSRLPEQMEMFNAVFDQITLVVGKSHLTEAVNLVPDWWGITIAKRSSDNSITFNEIRPAETNAGQKSLSVVKLLWRDEALQLLEEAGLDNGLRSKTRSVIYTKLSETLEQEFLVEKVREILCFRKAWRSGVPLTPGGDLNP